MERAGEKFVGEGVAGAAATGGGRVAALNHETGDDAVKRLAVEVGFARGGAEGAFSEADETGDSERGFLKVEFAEDHAAGRGELGIETGGRGGGAGDGGGARACGSG